MNLPKHFTLLPCARLVRPALRHKVAKALCAHHAVHKVNCDLVRTPSVCTRSCCAMTLCATLCATSPCTRLSPPCALPCARPPPAQGFRHLVRRIKFRHKVVHKAHGFCKLSYIYIYIYIYV